MNTKPRDEIIDCLRGVAIMTMVLSHMLYFRVAVQTTFTQFLSFIANFNSFTSFLFCFGIGMYFSTIRKPVDAAFYQKQAKRLFFLLIAYYILAWANMLTNPENLPRNWHTYLRIAALIKNPYLTEFMVPFIVYTIFVVFCKIIASRITVPYIVRDTRFWLVLSMIGFVVGSLAFTRFAPLQHSNIVRSLANIAFGQKPLYGFPLLQYAPIFVLGLFFGPAVAQKLAGHPHAFRKLFYATIVGLFSLHLAIWYSVQLGTIHFLNYLDRFPPTLYFLVLSLGLTFAVFALLYGTYDRIIVYRAVTAIGRSAWVILVFHLVFFSVVDFYHVERTNNVFLLALWYFAALLGGVFMQKIVELAWRFSKQRLPVSVPFAISSSRS